MKLMILDGNSLINRAFYGIRPLTTREGLYTNAVYGFLNILHKFMGEERPDGVCVAFDLKAPTFRHLQYEGYKATRHGMPDELAQQMPVMKDVLRAMSIPIYEQEGWEADDILGTVGRICAESGWECVILTGDRDSLQLVDDHVTVRLVSSKAGQTLATRYTPETFREEYGFDPIRLVDCKALMGDSSDNIPGVPGVGKKTAGDLLAAFGSLDAIYDHLDSDAIKPAVKKKLEAGKDSAYLSYDLATIRKTAPIDFVPADNVCKPVDKPALRALFEKLEFVRLMDRYGLYDVKEAPQPAEPAAVVCTLACLPPVGTPCALVLDGDQAAIATADGVCVTAVSCCEPLLTAETPKVCADYKTLWHQLDQLGLPKDGFVFDVSLAGYVLDPSDNRYSPDELAKRYLNQEGQLESLSDRAAAVFALWKPLQSLMAEQNMTTLYETVEFPLCAVLARMEREGIAVDRMALLAFGNLLTERINALTEQIYDMAGETFNINSTQQLGVILFEKLGLPPVKKTKTGYSTNAEVLEKLKNKHPIIEAIMDYRMVTKLNSTYAEGLVKVIGDDERIHTTFQNMVTATGRLSSTEPNLQNIPVRTELGSEIRKMFVPKDGCVLIDADYSQIELRVLSHIANDQIMQEAFRSGEDVHRVTASQVFGVAPEDVTSLMRRHAKAVNFGIVYGISDFSLADDIGVTRKEAKAYIESYLEKYAGVRQYMHDVVEQAKADGYVTTLMGRRRYLPELKSKNFNLRSFGERCAMNTPIQGTAADIIKLAMIRVDAALAKQYPQARLVLQVHDELIVECPLDQADDVKQLVEREMEQVMELRVPLLAEAKSGASWYEAK